MYAETTWSAQVPRIVRALARVDGGRAIDISEKTFPRIGPAEPGTGYRERTHHCRPEAPVDPPISPEAEEIVITLRGAMPAQDVDVVRQMLDRVADESALGVGPEWETRIRVAPDAGCHIYELVVFTNPGGEQVQ